MIKLKLRLKAEFERILQDCDEMWVAAAMISDRGMQFIRENLNKDAKQHYIVGVGLPTTPSVLEYLKSNHCEGVFKARIYNKGGILFHPKVYLFRVNDRITAYVGSANCTFNGFAKNTEVSLRTDDKDICGDLVKWFETTYKTAHPITDSFIEEYSSIFQRRMKRMEEDEADIEMLFEDEESTQDIDKMDFTHQFFTREHFAAFEGKKPWDHSASANSEREKVQTKLFQLDDKITPILESKGWDIHRHYSYGDTVSSAIHGTRTSNKLGGMWLHYGRTKEEIKNYGKDETPLDYMRMQVIIHKGSIGIWNRIGKNNGSRVDRENLKNNLKDQGYRTKLFNEIMNLTNGYYLALGQEILYVPDIIDEKQLTGFLLKDDYRDFFTIGIDLMPDDERLSKNNIINTVVENFRLLLPIYELIKHTMPIIK